MPAEKPILGMIAGNGILPLIIAQSARASGYRVCCVGLKNQYIQSLPESCDVFAQAGMAKIGKWVRLLKRWDVNDAVMVGGVIPLTFVFLLVFLNTNIHNAQEVERLSPIPILGMIGKSKMDSSLAVFESPKSSISEF